MHAKIAPNRLIAEFNISEHAESARNPIASHVNFGDDSALSAFTRTQWTVVFRMKLLMYRLCAHYVDCIFCVDFMYVGFPERCVYTNFGRHCKNRKVKHSEQCNRMCCSHRIIDELGPRAGRWERGKCVGSLALVL